MKVCTKCKVKKPLADFHVCKRAKSGKQPRCKQCRAEYKQEPVARKARNQRYRENNRNTINERNRKYRIKNKDKVKEYQEKNKEKIAISKRLYWERNKNEINRKRRNGREIGPPKTKLEIVESHRKSTQLWKKKNPDKVRMHRRIRRMRERAIEYEKYNDIEVFARDNWVCQLCLDRIDRRTKYPHPKSASIDHIIPLVDGGGDVPTNVQCTHLLCNLQKNRYSGGQLLLL